MKIFLDANIIISILNRQYPAYTYTSQIISIANRPKTSLVTTSVCLAIAFYYAEKKIGTLKAKNKIDLLVQNVSVVDCGKKEVLSALKNKKVHDVEDGMEYYAALHAECDCIVTDDLGDYYFSELEILGAEDFYKRYILNN